MMKTEYAKKGGCLQRDNVEHEEYAGAYSTDSWEAKERDGAELLEKVLERENLNRAYKRVKANKGAPGIDGMTVEEVLPWLKEHKGELLESIRNGKYKPSPVRRKEIPKGDGGVRKLGIPTVIDRIIRNFKFLDFTLGRNKKGAYIRVHAKSLKRAKQKLRELTSRSQGRNVR